MDLPKGHWIHSAMEKEKARIGKKKSNTKGAVTPKPLEKEKDPGKPIKEENVPKSAPSGMYQGGVVRPGPLSGPLHQPGVPQ